MSYSSIYFTGGTDLQRLLQNLKPRSSPQKRQTGSTYTSLLYMVGQLWYGPMDSTFLYVGENRIICETVREEFINIVTKKGYSVTKDNGVWIRATNQRFYFHPMTSWFEAMRGTTVAHAFVDVLNAPSYGRDYTFIQNVSRKIHYG